MERHLKGEVASNTIPMVALTDLKNRAVGLILSDPPCKVVNVRFATIPFKHLSDQG